MLERLNQLTWYQAMIAVAAVVLTATLSVDLPNVRDDLVSAAALAALFWGLAEVASWKPTTSYARQPDFEGIFRIERLAWRLTAHGVLLYLIGLGCLGWLVASLLGFI